MRTYELVFVVDPRVSDEDVVAMTQEYKQMITAGGSQISKEESWGRRKLAYPIAKLNEGKYVLLGIESEGGKSSLPEVEHRMRQNDKILRYLTVRTDEDLKRAASRHPKTAGRAGRASPARAPPVPRAPLAPIPQPDPRRPPQGRSNAMARPRKVFYRRRKVCKFCADKIDYVDFKDVKLLQQFIPERSKILPRRISGTCARHQRLLQQAIKRARHLALIPFTTD